MWCNVYVRVEKYVSSDARPNDPDVWPALVWGLAFKTSLECVCILQRKAVRIITKTSRRANILPMFLHHNFLTFHDIVKSKVCKLLYKRYKGVLSSELMCKFSLFDCVRRNGRVFQVQYCRTTLKSQCISVRGPKLFNALPAYIQNANNVKRFNILIKRHLVTAYID